MDLENRIERLTGMRTIAASGRCRTRLRLLYMQCRLKYCKYQKSSLEVWSGGWITEFWAAASCPHHVHALILLACVISMTGLRPLLLRESLVPHIGL